MLCPGSLTNPPQSTEAGSSLLATMILKDTAATTLTVPASTTTYVKISQSGSITWSEFSYLQVDVAANPVVPPSNETAAAGGANSSAANSNVSARSDQSNANLPMEQQIKGSHMMGNQRDSMKVQVRSSQGSVSGGLQYDDILFNRRSKEQGLVDQTRRSDASSTLNWYFRTSFLPDLSHSPPVFDYSSTGNSSITLSSPVRTSVYYMALQSTEKYVASVTASQKTAVMLAEGQPYPFSVNKNEHTFMYFYPSDDGLVLLQPRITPALSNVNSRMFVRLGALATERSWSKWVGGHDSEIDGMADYSYTSVLFLKSDGDRYISWTIDPGMKSIWTMTPYLVAPTSLQLDTPMNFAVDKTIRAQLFSAVPSDTQGNFYFQLMPSSAPTSQTYRQWQTLQAATRIYAATKRNGRMAYYQVSDWGYTSDGTPGLQVMIDQWDQGATVYLLLFMENDAPSNEFSVVAFMAGSSFSSWKWWFGGVLFAVFVFCAGRCVLCRGPRGVSLFGIRSRNVRSMGTNTGLRGEVELQQVEEVCSTEPAPEVMKKVADTLYRRNETGSTDTNSVHVEVTVEAKDDAAAQDKGKVSDGTQSTAADAGAEASGAVASEAGQAKGEGGEGGREDGGGEDTSCIVCLDRDREAILLECGHGGLCLQCATSLWNQGPAGRHCPMCRKVFSGVMKIVEEQEDMVKVQAVHYAYKPPESSSAPRISILGIRDVLSSITGNVMSRGGGSEGAGGGSNSSAIVLGLVTDNRRRPYPVQVRNETQGEGRITST